MSTTTVNPVLQVRRVFEATPEELFDAWFEREQWQAWIGPEGCQCEVPLLEPRVGGRYRILMHLSDGREIPVEGEFKTVDRPRTLAFTWGWALSEGTTGGVSVTSTVRINSQLKTLDSPATTVPTASAAAKP